jgi:hypothetical protein
LDTLLDFPVTDDVFFEEGDIETYYVASCEETGEENQSSSREAALWWLGNYEGEIYRITKRLIGKRVYRDKA